jgi:biopolymer transport protein ExbD
MSMDVGAKKGPRSDINITPLVDIVLVLLIIFMVLTPLMEKELAVRVPEEPTPEELAQPPPPDLTQFIFKVDEAGLFHVNSETLTDDNAAERLKVYYRAAKAKEATQGPPVIFFDADDKAKYERAIKGLDLIRDSSPGWTIGMMTEKIASQAPAGETAPGAAPEGAPPAPGATPPAPPGATPPAPQ